MSTPDEILLLSWREKPSLPQFTLRATLVGLLIGSIVLVSNFQFGLQTGWVSMMSLPSALLGFAMFKFFSDYLGFPFTDVENVFVQSVAVAVGTGPLAYGFVGIIPAIEKFLTKEESGTGETISLGVWKSIVWSTGLAFFGVFFAIPLRKQVIVKEKLPFPSGSATATLISVLHNTEIHDDSETEHPQKKDVPEDEETVVENTSETTSPDDHGNSCTIIESQDFQDLKKQETYASNIRSLVLTFSISAIYTILSYFVPFLKTLPLFGTYLSENYLWNFQLSPAYIGQGIIMGLPTVSYMLFGCILGWGILAPLSKQLGFAPGPIDDWKTGGQGWILWVSLAVMVSDSLISLFVVVIKSLIPLLKKRDDSDYVKLNGNHNERLLETDSLSSNEDPNNAAFDGTKGSDNSDSELDIDSRYLVELKTTVIGLIGSSLFCIAAVKYVFGDIIPVYSLVIAILLALALSILGVRALGETDLNPVSGIGKLSQLIFALIIPKTHPGVVLINLVAGGIAEAGAQQAGDLMQDLKTGHLIGASPKAQFIAQMIGTTWSIFLSSVMYKVYNAVYEIPGKVFRIPTAVIWIDCSRLVTGQGLPPHAFATSIVFGVIFAIISLLKNLVPKTNKYHKYLVYLPSGVAVGIGIYNSPSFTLARFLGGVISSWWMRKNNYDHDAKITMIVLSSGLVLGEGLLSSFTMLLTSLGVPHL